MKYRPDIDGLRAVAVMPVILYHAGLPGPSGGYVGVDIFFVISGFLITSIVANEIRVGQFSLINFYERRARRILPALLAMILLSFAIGWRILLPTEFADLGASAFAAVLFVSNMYFLMTEDYFSVAAEFAPLLHTWSLAVEEQFYLVFPPLLAALYAWRGMRLTIGVVTGITAISFVAAVMYLPQYPDEVFYLIIFRAWELGFGALAALLRLPPPSNRSAREALGVAGLLLILVPVFAYTSQTSFPGLAALPPVLGAVVLIHIGAHDQSSAANRLLALGPMVAIGLISYSLYLWHWPILAFMRLAHDNTSLPLWLALWAIALSFVLAWLSWRFVEKPFREPSPRGFSRRTIFKASATGMALVSVLALGLFASKGLPQRLSEETQQIAQVAEDRNPDMARCFDRIPENGPCRIGARATEQAAATADFLFWGDSHVNAMAPGLDAAALAAGQSGLFVAHRACVPLPPLRRVPDNASCAEFTVKVMDLLSTRADMPLIILGARWALSVEGTRYDVEAHRGPVHFAWRSPSKTLNQSGNAELVEAGLRETIDAILATGRQVVLLGPTPEIPWNVVSVAARTDLLGWRDTRRLPVAQHIARSKNSEEILKRVAATSDRVRYIPLADLFCDTEVCRVTDAEGRPLYVDDDHVSRTTAVEILGPRFADIWDLSPS